MHCPIHATFVHFLNLIEPKIAPLDDKCTNIPAILKLSVFLETCRTNGFCRTVATQPIHQMSQASVTRCVHQVAKVLAEIGAEV